jgi:uncharacterized protein
MEDSDVIQKTALYVQKTLNNESSGHDWWHIYRVWNTAKAIGKKEHANMFIVELSSLLHDIADYKLHGGDEEIGPTTARLWLETVRVDEKDIEHVVNIIRNISFKGAGVSSKMDSIEGKVVQDADRLDALGAIGIARTFAYGGHKGRLMHDPQTKPAMHTSFDAYKNNNSSGINHFYEKLLLLKDLMNTDSGRKLAIKRTKYMQDYLDKFFSEWDGKE